MTLTLASEPRIITQYIPDIIGGIVSEVSAAMGYTVFYDWGHYQEVVKNLTEKDQAITAANRMKYPLIWLVTDFEERMGSVLGLYAEVQLQFIIATDTEITYTMAQRRDNSFLPVLYPIYAELLSQLRKSKYIQYEQVEHVKIDRSYWGIQSGQGNGEANLFNDFIDAIQIKNVKLNIKRKIC